jgi:hypothetical protein
MFVAIVGTHNGYHTTTYVRIGKDLPEGFIGRRVIATAETLRDVMTASYGKNMAIKPAQRTA